ncbi:MAG: MATE family efflux transporter [Methanofollis sp.]|uniref:MATE family efflux transporter n=1 Tax=Methanofollis sp. TaxID=2052835 RepID=UPI00263469B2|nr:MATE family efflux transporter [Methanofollis sp.]MDD4255182.1 MATE family efflux transporter [Methanofollis sp.]
MKNQWETITRAYPWHFIGFLVLAMLIPRLYELTNVYWIGQISFDALAITEQYEFIAVTIEIVNEAIPFGILALIAQNYHNRERVISILKAGLILHVTFALIVTSIVLLFTSEFVSTIGTPIEIVRMTTQYLVLKSVALPFEAVAYLFLIAIKSMQKGREALYLVLVSVILNMILDLFLISNTSLSLHLGIQGVAIGYVISKIALMVISLLYTLHLLHLDWVTIASTTWKENVVPLFKIGGWTGLDSLVRNVGYMGLLLVLNVIGTNEFGGYGLAMWVMWTLLIPVLALGEGTSVVVGNYFGEKKYREAKNVVITSMILVIAIMVAIALIGVLYWENISAFFNPNPEMVKYSTETFWWLIIPYIGFGIGTVLRSVFYGTGQTRYIFYIACFVNIGMILPYVALVKLGFIPATFTSVMMFYTISFLADPVLAYIGVRRAITRVFPANEGGSTRTGVSP